MNTKSSAQSVLRDIAQIQHLERGALSVIRQGPDGPYYNHQCYEGGRNVSRYVPSAQVSQPKPGHHARDGNARGSMASLAPSNGHATTMTMKAKNRAMARLACLEGSWTSITPWIHAGHVLGRGWGRKEHPVDKARLGRWAKRRLQNQMEILMAATRRECAHTSQAATVAKALGYFQSGMFRGEPGAENIPPGAASLQAVALDECWKERLNAHAARNDGSYTNNAGDKMIAARDFRQTISARTQRELEFARGLSVEAVSAILEGETAEGHSILRDLVNAEISFKELARQTGPGEKSLDWMHSSKGNPTGRNLGGIIKSIN